MTDVFLEYRFYYSFKTIELFFHFFEKICFDYLIFDWKKNFKQTIFKSEKRRRENRFSGKDHRFKEIWVNCLKLREIG